MKHFYTCKALDKWYNNYLDTDREIDILEIEIDILETEIENLKLANERADFVLHIIIDTLALAIFFILIIVL